MASLLIKSAILLSKYFYLQPRLFFSPPAWVEGREGEGWKQTYFGLYPRVGLVELSEPLNLSLVFSLPKLTQLPSLLERSVGLAGGELEVIKADPNLSDS